MHRKKLISFGNSSSDSLIEPFDCAFIERNHRLRAAGAMNFQLRRCHKVITLETKIA